MRGKKTGSATLSSLLLIFVCFTADAQVAEAIKAFNATSHLQNAQVGFYAENLKTGEVLADYQSEKLLIPASILKLPTTIIANQILGADFQFETQLAYSGTILNDTLFGDIIILGGGDPSLGSSRLNGYPNYAQIFAQWTSAISDLRIKVIAGNVIGDAQIYDDEISHPTWPAEDIANYYGAGACGLTINESMYYLNFKTGSKKGEATSIISTEPLVPCVNFDNQVLTGSATSGDNAYIWGRAFTKEREVTGTIPAKGNFSIKGAMPDPAFLCAYHLCEDLGNAGVHVMGDATSARVDSPPLNYQVIGNNESAPLADIIYWTNKRSVNIFAESLLKTISLQKAKQGNYTDGLAIIDSIWQSIYPNNNILVDGSGLSPENKISPKSITKLLLASLPGNETIINSLPKAGYDADASSLNGMFTNSSQCQKTLKAKTGYMKGVKSYTGLVINNKEETICFTLIVNDYKGSSSALKKNCEQLLATLVH